MYVGVDWGGTKIEAVALSEDGAQLARVRVDTPRSDYTFSPCFYTPIVRAAHGDSSGVRRAAWLWKD